MKSRLQAAFEVVGLGWSVASTRSKLIGTALVLLLSVVWLPWNLFGPGGFAWCRHGDSKAVEAVRQLTERTDLDSTVIVFHGFEGLITWMAAEIDFVYPFQVERAPQVTPRFKFLFLADQATQYPQRGPTESAEDVKASLDSFFAHGHRVLISDIWEVSEAEFVDRFATILQPDKFRAIYKVLKSEHLATPVFHVQGTGWFYELRPRNTSEK